MAYPFQSTNFTDNNPSNKTYNIAGVPFGVSRKGLPEIKAKRDSVLWDFLFLGLSIAVGILTEGLGDLVFAGLLAVRTTEGVYAITEGLATVIAGSVQTFFEVSGQLGVNVLAGRTSTTAIISAIMPGLGVFGLGKVFKGLRLMRNEKLLLTSLLGRGVDRATAKEIVFITKELIIGKDLEENLFLNSIRNNDWHSVRNVRTFREKIIRSSGGDEAGKLTTFYKYQSKKYGHETTDHIPDLINKRLSKQYDVAWKMKVFKQRLVKIYGKRWVRYNEDTGVIDSIVNGIEAFKLKSSWQKDSLLNRTLNKPRNVYKLKRQEITTNKEIGKEATYYNKLKNKKWTKRYKMNEQINEKNKYLKKVEPIYKTRKALIPTFVKEEDRLLDYSFRMLRKVTNPLRLLKPTNFIRYVDRKLGNQIEKLALKNNWFSRILQQINKVTKHTKQLDLMLIKRFNLIPAVDSKWIIGFRMINGSALYVEIFYHNHAKGTIVIVQRELFPDELERMLVAFETGQAGEFYNRELALGWGLKKEWVNNLAFTNSLTIRTQSYLYSSWWAYRNVKSFNKSIHNISSGRYSNYNWAQNIKDYSIIRLIRTSGSLVGLGWLSAGLGISLYRGRGFTQGLSSSFARRTRTSIKRYKRKPYHNPRKRKGRV